MQRFAQHIERDRLSALIRTQGQDSMAAARRHYLERHGGDQPEVLGEAGARGTRTPIRQQHVGDRQQVRWVVPWRLAVASLTVLVVIVGAIILRSQSAVGTPVELGTPLPMSSSQEEVLVHVVGEVVTPGLVRIPPGSRVADAIEAAGGPTDGADLSAINMARPASDGEQVQVPAIGASSVPAPADDGLVSLNSADLSALDELPGIGPVLADRIVEARPFTSVDDLDQVDGIGPSLMSRLRPLVTL